MPSKFKDAQGRDWTVVINGKVLVRARNHGKLNLGDIIDHATGRINMDPALVLELCYYGCEGNVRIQAGKVDKDDFLEAMVGKTLLNAMQATAEALGECFSPPEDVDEEAATKLPLEEKKS